MKVLVTVPSLELPGGVATFYRALRLYLPKDCAYFEIGARPSESGWWAAVTRLACDYVRFSRELSRSRYDLVHINPSLGPRSLLRDGILLLIARLRSLRVVVFFHGWDAACEGQIDHKFRRLFCWVFGKASVIVVLAEQFQQTLTGWGLTAPILLGTTTVEDSLLEEGEASPVARRTGERCGILYLSRLDWGKGLLTAIRAFELVRARSPATSLTVVGDGPERITAEQLVRGRGISGVEFVGYLGGQEKRRAFREADVYFFPTAFGEGMPISVLEAMASGLPVVTRLVGGVRDFFEDGRMGYVTDSDDPEVHAELLGRLVEDPGLRTRMGLYNREFASKRFAASVVAAKLQGIYEQVVGQPASN